jgi:hypothetical protein
VSANESAGVATIAAAPSNEATSFDDVFIGKVLPTSPEFYIPNWLIVAV